MTLRELPAVALVACGLMLGCGGGSGGDDEQRTHLSCQANSGESCQEISRDVPTTMSCPSSAFHEVDACPADGIGGTCVTHDGLLHVEVRVYATEGLGPWAEMCGWRGGTWTAYPAMVDPHADE